MNRKEFIFIVIVTFIVVVIWVVADIIHTRPSVQLNPNLQSVLEPLDPTFDQSVINRIKSATPNEVIIQETPLPPLPSPSVFAPDQDEATSEAGL